MGPTAATSGPLSTPGHVEVWYALADKPEPVGEAWSGLLGDLGLSSAGPPDLSRILEVSREGLEVPLVAQATHGPLSAKLFVRRKIVFLEIWIGAEAGGKDVDLAVWAGNQLTERLVGAGLLVGRTSVVTGKPDEGTEEFEVALSGGRLVKLADDRPHHGRYYLAIEPAALTTEAQADLIALFGQDVPLLDLIRHQLARQTELSRNTRLAIKLERERLDEAVGQILHESEWSSPKADVKELEDRIGRLSEAYGELASKSHVIRTLHLRLGRETVYLERHIRRLVGEAEEDRELLMGLARPFRKHVEHLRRDEEFLRQSVDNARAAIEVVRTQAELARSGESVALQQQTKLVLEEGISLQTAAGFIEYVIVFNYVLHSWELLAGTHGFEAVPAWTRLALPLVFAGLAVLATHYVAQVVKHKQGAWARVAVCLAGMLVAFGGMVYLTLQVA